MLKQDPELYREVSGYTTDAAVSTAAAAGEPSFVYRDLRAAVRVLQGNTSGTVL
jgi:hypothetical protein